MADREVNLGYGRVWIDRDLDEMPEEDVGHTCIYTVDVEDRNFKYCFICSRVAWRTNEEIMAEHGILLERKLKGT